MRKASCKPSGKASCQAHAALARGQGPRGILIRPSKTPNPVAVPRRPWLLAEEVQTRRILENAAEKLLEAGNDQGSEAMEEYYQLLDRANVSSKLNKRLGGNVEMEEGEGGQVDASLNASALELGDDDDRAADEFLEASMFGWRWALQALSKVLFLSCVCYYPSVPSQQSVVPILCILQSCGTTPCRSSPRFGFALQLLRGRVRPQQQQLPRNNSYPWQGVA